MGLFNKKPQDERVTIEQNKIYREIYLLIMVICTVSVISKFILWGIDLDYVITEVMIYIAGSIYYAGSSVKRGIFSAEVEMHDHSSRWSYEKKIIAQGSVAGLVIAVVFGLHSSYQYAETEAQHFYYFFLTFFGSLMIYLPVILIAGLISYAASKRKSDREVEKQLEDQ